MARDRVVALSGGVGGAKLALGLSRVVPDGQLTVAINISARSLVRLDFADAPLTEVAKEFPGSADGVKPFLEANYRAWRDALGDLDEAGWNAPLGPSWGDYADDNTFDLALHVLDEVVHHSAEVGLMRDLYSQRSSLQTGDAS